MLTTYTISTESSGQRHDDLSTQANESLRAESPHGMHLSVNDMLISTLSDDIVSSYQQQHQRIIDAHHKRHHTRKRGSRVHQHRQHHRRQPQPQPSLSSSTKRTRNDKRRFIGAVFGNSNNDRLPDVWFDPVTHAKSNRRHRQQQQQSPYQPNNRRRGRDKFVINTTDNSRNQQPNTNDSTRNQRQFNQEHQTGRVPSSSNNSTNSNSSSSKQQRPNIVFLLTDDQDIELGKYH